jgi:hypothetical protein
MERWGQYFKPAGMGGSGQATGNSAPKAATPAPAKAAPADDMDDEDPPFDGGTKVSAPAAKEESAGGDASSRAADIIAMIRKRQST